MIVGDGSSVPAGWYPDPADAARLRRWDGANWTADVVLAQPSVPLAPPAAATPPVTPTPPIYQPSVQPAPVQSAPVQSAPVQSSPVQPSPVQPSPVQSAPAQESSPTATAAASGSIPIPDWANLPGLTLPPDLSAFAGFSGDSVLKQPKFDDPAMFEDPLRPSVASPFLPRPIFEEPPVAVEPLPFESSPPGSVPPPPAPAQSPQQEIVPSVDAPSRRRRREEDTTPARPAAPYAPPPSGAQYNAPPPPGVAYTPPAPGVALHPSALPLPPTASGASAFLPGESRLVPTRLIEQAAGARITGTPAARAGKAGHFQAAQVQPTPGRLAGQPGETRSGTLGVWLLAVLPLLQFAVVYAVFGVLAEPLVPGIQWGILVVPALFSLLFAAADRKKLLDNGHDETPNAVLGILAPLYLIARVAVIGPRSIAPLVVWVVLQAAAVAGVLVLLPAVLAAAISSS